MKAVILAVVSMVALASYGQTDKEVVTEGELGGVTAAKPATSIESNTTKTVGTFNKLWVRSLTIVEGREAIFIIGAYDGTNTLAEADRRLVVHKADKDEAFSPLMAGFLSAVQTAAGKAEIPKVAGVSSRDTKSPTVLSVAFPGGGAGLVIRDLYGSADAGAVAIRAEYEKILAWLAAYYAAK